MTDTVEVAFEVVPPVNVTVAVFVIVDVAVAAGTVAVIVTVADAPAASEVTVAVIVEPFVLMLVLADPTADTPVNGDALSMMVIPVTGVVALGLVTVNRKVTV